MLQLKFRPELYSFDTCREFHDVFRLTEEDIVLTNRYIYDPFFGDMGIAAHVVYQEDFGTGEPTDVMVDAILRAIEKRPFRRLIAVGGGTVIDIAKVLAVAGPGQSVEELYADMAGLRPRCDLVLVPTTCGTGSEVTNISILNRTSLGTKMGLVSEGMYADKAVLIPELLSRLPYGVFATSSIDALVHAVESSLSDKATPYTMLFGCKAMELIIRGYRTMQRQGPEARVGLMKDFLFASNYAGLAFGTAGCGAVHALSYPLGGKYHVPHGEANYSVFMAVMQAYEKKGVHGRLAVLLNVLASLLDCAPEEAFDRLAGVLASVLPLKPLRAYGMVESDIPVFAHGVLESQQRLLANNYVPLSEEDIRDIYAARL